MLEMRQICKHFPGVQALIDVNFSVKQGEIHALVGENGAGKSTLMNCLGGLLHPDGGSLNISGQNVVFANPQEAYDRGVAFVHQETSLLDNLTVAENIFLGHEPRKSLGFMDRQKMIDDTQEFFSKVGITIDPSIHASKLKMSEKQMVEIARALISSPRILIMDEPTAALNEVESNMLFSLLRELKATNTAVIYISHRLDEIVELADRVTVLKDGKNAGELSGDEITKHNMITLMIGRELTDIYPEREESFKSANTILSVENLQIKDSDKKVSFELREGEILGIGGLEGQGQRDVLRAVIGTTPVISGDVLLDGESLINSSIGQRIKKGLFYLTDDRRGDGLILPMSIENNISLSSLDAILNLMHLLDERKESDITQSFIERLDIKARSSQQTAGTLSGGNQQKVMIARALSALPRVIIFDEPTKGIDVGARMSIYQIIAELTKQGVAVIVLTSDLMELIGISDRILVFHDKGISGEISACDATEARVMQAAYGESLNSEGANK